MTRLVLRLLSVGVAFATILFSAPRTAHADDTPSWQDCTNATIAKIYPLFVAANSATPDSFATAYRTYKAAWDALSPLCNSNAGQMATLKSTVNQLAPDIIAANAISRARADLNGDRDAVQLATDEPSIDTLAAAAKKTVTLMNTAYAEMAAANKWPSYTCYDTENVLRQRARLLIANPEREKRFELSPTEESRIEESANRGRCEALDAYAEFEQRASGRRGATKSLCGGFSSDGKYRQWCLTYGLISGAVSYIWKTTDNPAGMGGTALLSLLVPYGGVRLSPWPYEFGRFVAFDLNVYSAYLTSSTLQTPQPTSCIANGNALERSLHCETNPVIHPYAAIGLGLTVGQDKIGYFSIVPVSLGFAQFGAQGIHAYFGMYASILQLTGRF